MKVTNNGPSKVYIGQQADKTGKTFIVLPGETVIIDGLVSEVWVDQDKGDPPSDVKIEERG